jgi:Asp-tRNA(Asn)/Glu-tRNA(Gln) amidotransferase C subunit
MDQDQERRLAALAALDLDEAARARLAEELAQITAHLDRLTAFVEDEVAEGRTAASEQPPPAAQTERGPTAPPLRKDAAEG